MKSTFFGRHALAILCVVFFLVPFALRGARLSLERMENNVKDWLPSDFKETKELDWFARHFIGEESFVLLTYEGCSQDDESFQLFVDKLRGEVAPAGKDEPNGDAAGEPPSEPQRVAREKRRETERARQLGDELGLHTTGNYHQNWGRQNEKWLKGDDGWYYITPDGRLYRWQGRANLAGAMARSFQRHVLGQMRVDGVYVDTFGTTSTFTDKNDFHADPRRLTARVLKSVTTGPDLINELASPDGPLWPYGTEYGDDERPRVARVRAYERLKGAMFAPAAFDAYRWTAEDLPRVLTDAQMAELPEDWKERVGQYITGLVDVRYGGDHGRLVSASLENRDRFWREMFEKLEVDPPAIQTAIMVTLSKAGKKDLRRVMGRGLLGKPRGKLIDLAVESGIPGPPQPPLTPWGREPSLGGRVLRMGGPPVDNVAIDEEGQITLVRLVGFSIGLGLVLSFLCFRSFLVTLMVFLVGGVSAVTSLSIVYWTNSSVDAVLMSMPALVYVLGLSGAIHIVNYYRDTAEQHGRQGAPGRALRLGWLPCTLAAFTTALGLMSLCKSNILPIKKFGLFSAVGVMATLALLFTYLPSALQVWPPGYDRRRARNETAGAARIGGRTAAFWEAMGKWIIRRHGWVTATCLVAFVVVGYGITRLNTSIQLLKLFDPQAKIIRDYRWLEGHVGKLVPMELVIRIDESKQQATSDELVERDPSGAELRELKYKYKFLQRIGIVAQIQRSVEETFGAEGQDIVGRALSAASFAPDVLQIGSAYERATVNQILERNVSRYRDEDYLRVDGGDQSELWRISVRLGALNDVDYGEFVSELKRVVEPVVSAYDGHERILRAIENDRLEAGPNADDQLVFNGTAILVLGRSSPESAAPGATTRSATIDQTRLFSRTLDDLLRERGYRQKAGRQRPKMWLAWNNPEVQKVREITPEAWGRYLDQFDCVVLVQNHPDYNLDFIRQHSKSFVDATNHVYSPDNGSLTAKERGRPIQVTYTGVVPVVYKAQATLLVSLIDSIGWAFVMIAVVMMFVLRNGPWGMINIRGGLISMLPNLFPVVLIFGAMGHANVLIDIGTMMTASVAMGVAVDDTIHFLSWFRDGMRRGLERGDAILRSYRHVATAMTQTTLIGGLGLSIFAFSTFTPTQRFGIMMLTLLAAALVGDLVLLPAILAGPLGKYLCPKRDKAAALEPAGAAPDPALPPGEAADVAMSGPAGAPHTPARGSRSRANLRFDSRHK